MVKKLFSCFLLLLFLIYLSGCVKSTAVKPATLIAHYEFEDNLSDSCGNFSDGVVIGSKIGETGGAVTYTDGIVGKAVYLDGNSGIQLPDNLIHSYKYSIALWLKAEQLTNFTPVFFGCVKKDTPNEWLSIPPGGLAAFEGRFQIWSNYNDGSTWFDGLTNVKLETNKWYHIVVVVNEGELSVYINGQKQNLDTRINGQTSLQALFPDLFSNKDAIFTIGVNYWDTPFKGLIDDLRIYDGVLTDSDVSTLVKS